MSQLLALVLVELAWAAVDHAQGAQGQPLAIVQRRAGIEADVRGGGDQRIVAKTCVIQGVAHFQQGIGMHGVGAEGQLARGLLGIQADPALEPLALGIDQRDQGNGRVADLRSQCGDVIEHRLGRGVEQFQGVQGCQALLFVAGDGGLAHHALPVIGSSNQKVAP